MAQSRSGKTGKKTTSSGRSGKGTVHKAPPRKSSSGRTSRRAQRRAESTNLISSVVMAGFGLLMVALILVPGNGPVWATLKQVIFGLFGMIAYIIGPFLLYLAYLRASGYRVTVFAGKVSLMALLCASVPVVFSGFTIGDSTPWQVIKMLYAWGNTHFWAGGVTGVLGALLLALMGRPASNVIMLLVFLMGLMVFFALTPADVVQFTRKKVSDIQEARAARAAEETAYDTQLFGRAQEEESFDELNETIQEPQPQFRMQRPSGRIFDVEAETMREESTRQPAAPTMPVRPAQPEQPVPPVQPVYAQPSVPPVSQMTSLYTPPMSEPVYSELPMEPVAPPAEYVLDVQPDSSGAAEQSLKNAVENDPLEPVFIGPGGTFGLDPLSQLSRPAQPARQPAQPMAQEIPAEFEQQLAPVEEPHSEADELEELINRAMNTPSYPAYSAPAQTAVRAAVPTEDVDFETKMNFEIPVQSRFGAMPQQPQSDFETTLLPVEPEEGVVTVDTITDLSRAVNEDAFRSQPGDTMALPTYAELQRLRQAHEQAAEKAAPITPVEPVRTFRPAEEMPPIQPTVQSFDTEISVPLAAPDMEAEEPPVETAPEEIWQEPAPAAPKRPVIPTIGGSFEDFDVAKAAWNAGIPMSAVLSGAAVVPGAEMPLPAAEELHEEEIPVEVESAPAASAWGEVRPAQMARPQNDVFTQPTGGEAARLRVESTVGNSASAPISSPPNFAKRTVTQMAPVAAAVEEPKPEPYCYPSLNLFNASKPEDEAGAVKEMKRNADILSNTLDSFGVKTKILDICRGPSVTRYELQPQAGIKVSRITSLADDIALNLATAGVRIEAPIPGKPAVGIEVPNRIRSTVGIRSVFESQNYINMRSPLTMALGKDIAGVAQTADLCKMPHLLIAGSTGSGKSVCVNSIIISFLFRSGPEDVKLLLIDPKVVELAEYNGIPHLLMPVVTEPRKAAGALGACVAEMERRYKLFAENNVREIKSYNKLAAHEGMEHLPYIAIVVDELADLMMVAGKEVEDYICRIAQKARAAGIHLIIATQRPSVDVITGLIKANVPSRIAFAVSSQIDSRTILDGSGAEKLLGNGDMLFLPVGAAKPTRVQGTFVTDEEISAVLNFIKSTSSAQYDEEMIAEMERRAVEEKGSKRDSGGDSDSNGLDPMFEMAAECVIEAGQASTSMLQRKCKLGYARAARIMDQLEQNGIIGPYEGAKPRSVVVTMAQWQERKLSGVYEN